MQTCEFCGSLIPDHARFCGHCGRVPSKAMETDTMASDFLMQEVQDIDTAMIANVSGNFQPNAARNQQSNIGNIPITLLSLEEEEEEERRRRAALLGMEAPLLGSLAAEGIPNAEKCQWLKVPHRWVEFQPCKVHPIHLQVLWNRECIQVQRLCHPNCRLQ